MKGGYNYAEDYMPFVPLISEEGWISYCSREICVNKLRHSEL
jgi:hypothetical protein